MPRMLVWSLLSALLLALALTPALSWANNKKDCSHVKSMTALKQCDSAQYDETQALLNRIQGTLDASDRTQAEASAALQKHNETIKKINQDLAKTLEEARKRPQNGQ
jgi:septal ring factor EnvC (AmiA/AmiB activator)